MHEGGTVGVACPLWSWPAVMAAGCCCRLLLLEWCVRWHVGAAACALEVGAVCALELACWCRCRVRVQGTTVKGLSTSWERGCCYRVLLSECGVRYEAWMLVLLQGGGCEISMAVGVGPNGDSLYAAAK